MTRRLISLASATLLVAALSACGADSAEDSPSSTSDSAAEDTSDTGGADAEDETSDEVTTRPGGGSLEVTGEYQASLSFDSTWCQFLNGEFAMFYAPHGPQSGGTFVVPEDGVMAEGFPETLTMSFDTDGTAAFTMASGPSADGYTLMFDAVEILVTRAGEPNRSATVSGTLECSHIENMDL